MSIAQLAPEWNINSVSPVSTVSDQRIYALIEPLLWPDFQSVLADNESEALFDRTRFASVTNGPQLVHLGQELKKVEALQRHFESAPAGCLMMTPDHVGLHALAESLRSRVTVTYNQAATVLRFYEPRKLVMFLGALSTEQRQQFFPRLNRIDWYDKQWLSAQWPAGDAQSPLTNWVVEENQVQTMTMIANQWQGVSV